MRKLFPFITLILLGSCASHSHKIGDEQMQTIHKFIGCLKKHDWKSVNAMLPFKDTSAVDHNRNRYDIYEKIQIGEALIALEDNDIAADSLWVSDTIRMNGELYLSFVGSSKKDSGSSAPKSVFRFRFSLANSDTSLAYFDYNPPKPGQHETISENKPMQTIHQFIKYLKKNDVKDAQDMVHSLDSSFYIDHQEDFDKEFGELNSTWKALQQNDIDETTWQTDTVMVSNWIHIFIRGNLKKKPGNPYSNVPLGFQFLLDVSGPELWFLNYNDLQPETKRTNSPMQTIHQFIGYLKRNDIPGAKAMFSVQDTNTAQHRDYINYEMIQIEHARVALQHDDIIADSFWSSRVITVGGKPYLSMVGIAKKDFGRSHFKSVFKFVFYFHNSDTLLDFFDYNPPKANK